MDNSVLLEILRDQREELNSLRSKWFCKRKEEDMIKLEIDFIITEGHKISPIEVKSSGYRSHASLEAFYEIFSRRINREYLVYSNVYKRET